MESMVQNQGKMTCQCKMTHQCKMTCLPETLKYWVGVQWGQSYLMGRRCIFSFCWQPFYWWCHNKNALWGRSYINQFRTPSFPFGLVKTESGFIVRWVETGLGRWMLVVDVISVDAYPFLAFSDLTCHLQDMGISVFWLHCAAW